MSEKRLDFISAYEKIVYDLRKESEKLIQKHCISCELVNLQTREIDKLKKENEYLRNELKEVCNRDCDKCAEEWCDEIIDKYFEDD